MHARLDGEEHDGRQQHDEDAPCVATARCDVHVEGDGLVLALLERVPQPQRTHALVDVVAHVLAREQLFGEHRREVLERRRRCELRQR